MMFALNLNKFEGDTEGNTHGQSHLSAAWIWNPSYNNLTEGTLLHCSCFSFISCL